MNKQFHNKTKIIRAEHDSDNYYTCVSNNLIQDERLNVTEIGMMSKLLSHSDDYVLNTTYFSTHAGVGKAVFNKSLKHLIELGYIKKRRFQGGVEWIIFESPSFNKSDFSPIEISPVKNGLLLNNKELNNNEININKMNNKEINNNTRSSILGESPVDIDLLKKEKADMNKSGLEHYPEENSFEVFSNSNESSGTNEIDSDQIIVYTGTCLLEERRKIERLSREIKKKTEESYTRFMQAINYDYDLAVMVGFNNFKEIELKIGKERLAELLPFINDYKENKAKRREAHSELVSFDKKYHQHNRQ